MMRSGIVTAQELHAAHSAGGRQPASREHRTSQLLSRPACADRDERIRTKKPRVPCRPNQPPQLLAAASTRTTRGSHRVVPLHGVAATVLRGGRGRRRAVRRLRGGNLGRRRGLVARVKVPLLARRRRRRARRRPGCDRGQERRRRRRAARLQRVGHRRDLETCGRSCSMQVLTVHYTTAVQVRASPGAAQTAWAHGVM